MAEAARRDPEVTRTVRQQFVHRLDVMLDRKLRSLLQQRDELRAALSGSEEGSVTDTPSRSDEDE